jgi:hypothetical protein
MIQSGKKLTKLNLISTNQSSNERWTCFPTLRGPHTNPTETNHQI